MGAAVTFWCLASAPKFCRLCGGKADGFIDVFVTSEHPDDKLPADEGWHELDVSPQSQVSDKASPEASQTTETKNTEQATLTSQLEQRTDSAETEQKTDSVKTEQTTDSVKTDQKIDSAKTTEQQTKSAPPAAKASPAARTAAPAGAFVCAACDYTLFAAIPPAYCPSCGAEPE